MPRGNPTGKGGWIKGQSGNPGGRPRDLKEVTLIARQHGADAIRALVRVMSSKKSPPAAIAVAANSLLDRGFGKPTQTINANVSILDRLSYEEQRALEAALSSLPADESDAAGGFETTHH